MLCLCLLVLFILCVSVFLFFGNFLSPTPQTPGVCTWLPLRLLRSHLNRLEVVVVFSFVVCRDRLRFTWYGGGVTFCRRRRRGRGGRGRTCGAHLFDFFFLRDPIERGLGGSHEDTFDFLFFSAIIPCHVCFLFFFFEMEF